MASIDTNIEKPWQDLNSSKKALYLLDSGFAANCNFLVGEGANAQLFKCHKLILMMASPVFEREFCGDFLEAKATSPIPITDAQPSVFRLFLEFIYDPSRSVKTSKPAHNFKSHTCKNFHRNCNGNNISQNYGVEYDEKLNSYDFETLKDLLYLGKKYMVTFLEEKVYAALNNKLDTANKKDFIKIFELALAYDNKKLATDSAQRFSIRFATLEAELIYHLNASVLSELIKNVKCSTKTVLGVIEKYIEKNGLDTTVDEPQLEKQAKKRRKTSGQTVGSSVPISAEKSAENLKNIKQLYESVQFDDIMPIEFIDISEEPMLSKYLSVERKYEILKKLNKKSVEKPCTYYGSGSDCSDSD